MKWSPMLEQDARFRAAVREGIAQADREEFIEEEEMDARIERMLILMRIRASPSWLVCLKHMVGQLERHVG